MNGLYSVHSLVRGFAYQGQIYEEVKVAWFVVERQAPPAPYEQVIQEYGQLSERERTFPREYVDELFRRDEAEALKRHLDGRRNVVTFIEPVELPVPANSSGCRRLPRGGGSDLIGLFKEPGYPLPFQVEGYFSVRFAEARVQGDDKQTVIVRRPAETSDT